MNRAPHDIFLWTLKWAQNHRVPLWAAEETTSTNLIAKEGMAKEELAPLNGGTSFLPKSGISNLSLYLARAQTQGRGRGQNTWISSEGALLSSWRIELTQVPQPIFSPIIGLALYDAASDTWPEVDFNLKAPNDLYIGNKKVAGLLIETVDLGRSKHTVIGLGLNVFSAPLDLETATCLVDHLVDVLTEEKWRVFLDNWSARLKPALEEGLQSTMQKQTSERIMDALNRHPLLQEPILSVDEQGQLHSASRVIHWHEL